MTRQAKKAGAASIGRPLGFIGTLAMAMALLLAFGPSGAAAQQAVLRAGDGEESTVIPGQVIEIPIVMDMTTAAPLSFGSATFSLGWQTDRLTFVSATTLDPPPPPSSGLLAIEDLQYQGAFQLSSATFGSSSTNYALGRLAYNPAKHSLFLAGHAVQKSVAEFAIPVPGLGTVVSELPKVDSPIQPFVSILGTSPNGNPESLDRVSGMLWLDGQLIINAEQYYDAAGDNYDTSLLVRDADDLGGAVDGYFELNGRAKAAGYLAAIPAEWQKAFGAEYLTGWSSVNSIISRYSVGPTLWTFDPQDMIGAPTGAQGPVATTPFMNFSYGDGHFLADDALVNQQGSGSPIWNHLSSGVYGFIVPGTRTFAVFGSSGGVDSGVGYKITQDDGTVCGGYCSYVAADNYSYYWLFDVDDILGATNVYDPKPYAYGRWDVPFSDNNPAHVIIGATFDPVGRVLYLALSNAGRLGTYDRPPLILSYLIPE